MQRHWAIRALEVFPVGALLAMGVLMVSPGPSYARQRRDPVPGPEREAAPSLSPTTAFRPPGRRHPPRAGAA